jgi:hypothetical protein
MLGLARIVHARRAVHAAGRGVRWARGWIHDWRE